MAKKIKLTRPELKRQRDQLQRFERFLPMLKLKQQQLQLTMRELQLERREALQDAEEARRRVQPYKKVMNDIAGVNVRELSTPTEVKTSDENIAGVEVPVFEDVEFDTAQYSLFATPVWVDRTLHDLREMNHHQARAEILQRRYELLDAELTKIVQRVNLFEKVKIPDAREAIRRIRIKLGDEMTAQVARGKIAKAKISADEATIYQPGAESNEGETPQEAQE